MQWKTHLLFSIVIFLFLVKVNLLGLTLNNFIILLFATALPDIDIVGSWMSKKTRPVSNFIHIFSEHRGAFHSLLFCFLLSLIVFLIDPSYAILFFLGYFLHLVLDSFNASGVYWFWPSKIKIKGKVKFGGLFEAIFFIILSIISIILIISFL